MKRRIGHFLDQLIGKLFDWVDEYIPGSIEGVINCLISGNIFFYFLWNALRRGDLMAERERARLSPNAGSDTLIQAVFHLGVLCVPLILMVLILLPQSFIPNKPRKSVIRIAILLAIYAPMVILTVLALR